MALSYLYDHFKENMKDNEVDLIFYDLAKEGRAIINYMDGKNEQDVSRYSFEAYVDEVKVVAMNTTEFSSKVLKDVYVMGDMKDVYVMGERGYLSRTSRPRNAFSPPHPLRRKTGNAFLP